MAENALDNIIEVDIHNIIVQLYVGYYGRPPDPEGLAWWVEEYYPNHTLQETINAFGESDEYTAHFGDFPDSELIHNLYQQVFGRDADSERLKHYKALLESGEETLATIAYTIMSDAQNEDVDILALKVTVAEIFTDTLGKTLCDDQDYGPHSYDSSEDALLVRDYLLGVTDPLEIEAYKVAITDIAYTQFLEGVPICGEDGQSIVVDIIAPVFSIGSYVQKDENLPTWSPVYDAQAIDSSGEVDVGITYRLSTSSSSNSNYDNPLFTISPEGVVYFRQSPDYENPLSITRGNNYRILIEASDESGNTTDKLIQVDILDVDEIAPVFVSGSYVQKNENLSHWNPVYDAQAVDSSGKIDEGITYRLPFLKWDNGLFTINQQNGIVYFLQPPDYENPLDSGKDNSYTLLIEASDEYGNTSNKIVNLKILDVDENSSPPPFTVNKKSGDAVIVAGGKGTVTEDGEITGTLLVTDPDSLPLTSIYSSNTSSFENGSFTINPNTGVWTYTPAHNFNGDDHAVVVVMDALGNTSEVSIDFTVTRVDDITAGNDAFTVTANSTNNIRNVSLNDITDSGGSLSYDAVTADDTGKGLFSIDNSGAINYTPNQNFVGTDTVTYTVKDAVANEETTADITFKVEQTASEQSVSSIKYTWNSDTSKFTAEASSSHHTMVTVTVEDENGNPVTIGNPVFERNGSNGLITFDFSNGEFLGFNGTTAIFEKWTFTFTDSSALYVTDTYDVVISSEGMEWDGGRLDAEIILLRPIGYNFGDRDVFGGHSENNEHGSGHPADLIFLPQSKGPTDLVSHYIMPTVGSHIEGTPDVDTFVSFNTFEDVFFRTHIKITLADPEELSTAYIYDDDNGAAGDLVGVISMRYVIGIVVNDGNNEVTGNSEDNYLASYGRDQQQNGDVFRGLGGNDQHVGDKGSSTFYGGSGSDWRMFVDEGNRDSEVGVTLDMTNPIGGLVECVTGTSIDSDWIKGVENIVGTQYADDITGDDEPNILVGWKGADTLIGNGGDDILMIGDGTVKKIDGGSNHDTLWFNFFDHGQGKYTDHLWEFPEGQGGNIVFSDLTDNGANITNIERINLGDILDTVPHEDAYKKVSGKNGDNNLTLSYDDVLGMTDSNNILYIEGDPGDTVSFTDDSNTWYRGDDVGRYYQYTNDNDSNGTEPEITIYIETELIVYVL